MSFFFLVGDNFISSEDSSPIEYTENGLIGHCVLYRVFAGGSSLIGTCMKVSAVHPIIYITYMIQALNLSWLPVTLLNQKISKRERFVVLFGNSPEPPDHVTSRQTWWRILWRSSCANSSADVAQHVSLDLQAFLSCLWRHVIWRIPIPKSTKVNLSTMVNWKFTKKHHKSFPFTKILD